MRFRLLWILVWGVICPLQAESEVSLFAGWTSTGSLRTNLGDIEFDNFSLAGLRYERRYAFLGLENSLAYHFGSLSVPGAASSDKALSYSANLVINIPISQVVPFFTAGLGVFHKFGSGEPDVGSSFQTNYGFGLKLPRLAGPVGLRADFRRFNIRDVLDQNLRNNELSAGLLVSF